MPENTPPQTVTGACEEMAAEAIATAAPSAAVPQLRWQLVIAWLPGSAVPSLLLMVTCLGIDLTGPGRVVATAGLVPGWGYCSQAQMNSFAREIVGELASMRAKQAEFIQRGGN